MEAFIRITSYHYKYYTESPSRNWTWLHSFNCTKSHIRDRFLHNLSGFSDVNMCLGKPYGKYFFQTEAWWKSEKLKYVCLRWKNVVKPHIKTGGCFHPDGRKLFWLSRVSEALFSAISYCALALIYAPQWEKIPVSGWNDVLGLRLNKPTNNQRQFQQELPVNKVYTEGFVWETGEFPSVCRERAVLHVGSRCFCCFQKDCRASSVYGWFMIRLYSDSDSFCWS